MRRIAITLATAIALVLLITCARETTKPATATSAKALKRIGITQIASHPSLDDVRHGVIDGLAKAGFRDGKNITVIFRNANNDQTLAATIANDFVREKVDAIVPITTPSALAAAKATTTIPIVFGGVTDPIKAGLVTNLSKPGGNITGTSDRWPVKQQLFFFSNLLPKVRTLGVLYKPGDNVSAALNEDLQEAAPAYKLAIVTQPVSQGADVYSSATALLRRTDAIYVGADNLIVDNLESIIKAGREARKPILAGDTASVERGALATVSIGMRDLGSLTGDIVARVLRGEAPGSIPVGVVTHGERVVNWQTANAFGITRERVASIPPYNEQ